MKNETKREDAQPCLKSTFSQVYTHLKSHFPRLLQLAMKHVTCLLQCTLQV